MSNLVVNKVEVFFLKRRMLDAYEQTHPRVQLTGTITIYEKIGLFMQMRIEAPGYLRSYCEGLPASHLKFRLQKELEGPRKEQAPRQYAMALSAATLRKLLFEFERSGATAVTFKEGFVEACYIFLGKDRSEILRSLEEETAQMARLSDDDVTALKTINPFSELAELEGEHRKTLNPFGGPPQFRLVPLDHNNQEDMRQETLHFEGSELQLNRQNLDPGNPTITGKVQAELVFVAGQGWVLLNKSEYQTTLLQVNRPLTIVDQDVIVLGNRKFRFEAE